MVVVPWAMHAAITMLAVPVTEASSRSMLVPLSPSGALAWKKPVFPS